MGDYWKEVHRRTAKQAATLLGLSSREQIVIKAVVALAVICGLLFYGSADASSDEWKARLFGALAIVFLYPLIYLWKLVEVPAQIDIERQDEIRSLKDAADASPLRFEFNSEDNKFLEYAMIEGPKNVVTHCTIGRAAVRNTSRQETVEGVEMTLIHYKTDGMAGYRTIDKKLVGNSMAAPIVDLHPWRTENFNLFQAPPPDMDIPRLTLGPFADGDTKTLAPGRYQLKLTASGRSARPVSAYFLLAFDGGPNLIFRPWQDGDTTHEPQST